MRALVLIAALLVGCTGEEADTNPVPHMSLAQSLCKDYGGLKYIRVQHWKQSNRLHIHVICEDDTYIQRGWQQ